MSKRWILLGLVLVWTLVLASCHPAGRTAGQMVDDSAISTKVKAKLMNEDVLQSLAIDVDTFEGEVTLTGAVKTEKQKETAGAIARSVRGVTGVNNLLKVRP